MCRTKAGEDNPKIRELQTIVTESHTAKDQMDMSVAVETRRAPSGLSIFSFQSRQRSGNGMSRTFTDFFVSSFDSFPLHRMT